jgi:hypothetical protein
MKIDADEKELRESVERGESKSAGGGKRGRTRYARYAKATFLKERWLNIQLSSKDLTRPIRPSSMSRVRRPTQPAGGRMPRQHPPRLPADRHPQHGPGGDSAARGHEIERPQDSQRF